MKELASLIGALRLVRRRIFLGRLFNDSVKWAIAALLVLVSATAFSPTLAWALEGAAALVLAGLLASAIRALLQGPSLYQVAAQLDEAARLKDRLSTAFYFSKLENPGGLLRRQRNDALAHLAASRPRELFPLRAPAGAAYALVLMLAVAGLFAYRMHSGPPMLALWKRAAQTPLLKAMLSPIVHAMERNRATPARRQSASEQQLAENRRPESDPRQAGTGIQGTGTESTGNEKNQTANDSSRRSEQQRWGKQNSSSDDARQRQQEGRQEQETEQARDSQGNEQQDGGQGQSEQQREGGKQQAQNGSGNKNESSGSQQQQGDGQGGGSQKQSLAQTVMQALKNLLASAAGGRNNSSRSNAQMSPGPSQAQASPQTSEQAGNAGNNSRQPGQEGKEGEQSSPRSGSGPQQQAGQKSGTGIGTQPGTDQLGKNDPLPSQLVPDSVPLEAQQFFGEAQVRARAADGTVTTTARNVAPPSATSVTGVEQENVPLRYRLYVQRYFEHSAGGDSAAGKRK